MSFAVPGYRDSVAAMEGVGGGAITGDIYKNILRPISLSIVLFITHIYLISL